MSDAACLVSTAEREILAILGPVIIDLLDESGCLSCSASIAYRTLHGIWAPSGNRTDRAREIPNEPRQNGYLLPFCGIINTLNCHAVRFNHGLHTQCTRALSKESPYCDVCRKQALMDPEKLPPYGDIRERAKYGTDFRDRKGQHTVPYIHVAKRLNLNLEKAQAEASKLGLIIPTCQLSSDKPRRRKVWKTAAVSDSDSEDIM